MNDTEFEQRCHLAKQSEDRAERYANSGTTGIVFAFRALGERIELLTRVVRDQQREES